MSPLSQDWPQCNPLFKDASTQLKLIYHRWRVSWTQSVVMKAPVDVWSLFFSKIFFYFPVSSVQKTVSVGCCEEGTVCGEAASKSDIQGQEIIVQ